MRAWKVNPKHEFGSTVVFAETRGKAKALALNTDCCVGTDFLDVEVSRLKEADRLYKNRTEMDWDNAEDRLFLVKDCNWHCEYAEYEDCVHCVAKEECSMWENEV